jgi:NADH:ubiquinone reductase (H+-translocating)
MKQKQIVVIGTGFAGLAFLKRLHRFGIRDVKVTAIDERPYHLIYSNLYEVATAAEEVTEMTALKRSVAIPVLEILQGTGASFINERVVKVDAEKQTVELARASVPYDYLVMALGSKPNFYGIPGAEQYSFPLKGLKDTFKIRNQIEFLLQTRRLDMTKIPLRVVIAGGGIAGVEIAAELKGLFDFLSWKNNFPREKLKILVVEGSSQLAGGMGDRISNDIYQRLRELDVDIALQTMITEVKESSLLFNNGEVLHYDCLVWTAGVAANAVPFSVELPQAKGGRIMANHTCMVSTYSNIFVVGDQCCFMDPQGNPLPGTAQQAIHQGKYVAYAIGQLLQNKKPIEFHCKQFPFLITLGGKYAILSSKHFYIKGYLAYLIREFAWFKYFYEILGLSRAVQLTYLENKLYTRND